MQKQNPNRCKINAYTPEANQRKQLNRGGNKNTRTARAEKKKNNVNQTRNMEFETGQSEEKATKKKEKNENKRKTKPKRCTTRSGVHSFRKENMRWIRLRRVDKSLFYRIVEINVLRTYRYVFVGFSLVSMDISG